jgi:hypothetical protein
MNISSKNWNDFVEYREYWVRALHEILGWPKQRTLDWSKKWEELIKSGIAVGSFFHEEPSYYIIPLFTSKPLGARIREENRSFASRLMSRLQTAITPPEGPSSNDPLYDWSAAKQRVENVLADYGATLPRIDEEDSNHAT